MKPARLAALVVPGAVLLAACSGQTAPPADADANAAFSRAASLAATCSGCHAAGGDALADLEGWTTTDLETVLLRYQSEPDGTTVMHRIVRGYSDSDVTGIATYLGSQDR